MGVGLINIGIADVAVSNSPNILRTVLGSCVGICIYDPQIKTGGLAHIMLPHNKKSSSNLKKYADTAIPFMVDEMIKLGSNKTRLVVKLAGGATMFKHTVNSLVGDIGLNNITSTREVLSALNIPILSEDVGGDYGRTVDFYLETGEVRIKAVGEDPKTI